MAVPEHSEVVIRINNNSLEYEMEMTYISLQRLHAVLKNIVQRIEAGEFDPGKNEHPGLKSTQGDDDDDILS